MKLNEITLLELEGISKSIYEYTTDYYIRSYCKKLTGISYPRDERVLFLLVVRLCDWYEVNIDNILKGEYILNKKGHLKGYDLLLQMKNQLQEKYEMSDLDV